MKKRNLLKTITCIITACSILTGQALCSNAETTTSAIDLTEGGSFYKYQWAIKNLGNIRGKVTQSSMQARRMPGEDFGAPGGPGGRGRRGAFPFLSGFFNYDETTAPADDDTSWTYSVADIDLNVEPAWTYYESTQERRTVTVAVIDTGVDNTHSELAGSMWVNSLEIAGDGIDNDGNGYIDDINGWNFYSGSNQIYVGSEDDHGTHGAGTIAAAWDGTGTTGLADGNYVKIMSLKVFGPEDGDADMDNVIKAIRYAEANGADIVNLSMGAYECTDELKEAMANSSMLFVAAAGNGDYTGTGYDIDTDMIYPASLSYDNIISVANLMFDGNLSKSSNYGLLSVDLAAPGTYILSTEAGGGYGFMSGTSMAAPMVTGLAALIYSCRTDMTLMDVKTALLSTARQLEGLSGKVVTGGMPDAYAAITYGL